MYPKNIRLAIVAAGLLTLALSCTSHAAIASLLDLDLNQDNAYKVILHERAGKKTSKQVVYASAISATPAGHPDSNNQNPSAFTAVSLDLSPQLVTSGYWTPAQLGDLDPRAVGFSSQARLFRAANLYQTFSDEVDFSTRDGRINGGALQLAVWDVLYGDDLNRVNDASSHFFVTGKGRYSRKLILRANYYLQQLENNDPNLTLTFWMATDANGNRIANQDLLGPSSPLTSVPEPNYSCLAGSLAIATIPLFLLRTRAPSA